MDFGKTKSSAYHHILVDFLDDIVFSYTLDAIHFIKQTAGKS